MSTSEILKHYARELRSLARRMRKRLRDFVLFLRGKKKTRVGRWLGKRRKALSEATKAVIATIKGFVLGIYKRARLALAPSRVAKKTSKRSKKIRERTGEVWGEWRVRREIDAAVGGSEPLIIGPWLSEVGFEVLYWLPFLDHVTRKFKRMDRGQVIAVSRGGVRSWYAPIATDYVDIFDLMGQEEFGDRNAERFADTGTRKHLEVSSLDREILAGVRERLGLESVRVLHPSLMYRLLNPYWYGKRPFRILLDHAEYRRRDVPGPEPDWGLPEEYVAVKFYTSTALPDSPGNRKILTGIVRRLTEHRPVVLLDTGLLVDDHEDFEFADHPRVFSVRELMEPRDNLEIQTRIIAGARQYVGTCGALAWLAPMLGVDTIAVFADVSFLHTHLRVGFRAYEEMGAARFAPVDLHALETLDLGPGPPRLERTTDTTMPPEWRSGGAKESRE